MGAQGSKIEGEKMVEDMKLYDGLVESLPSLEGKVVAVTGCTTGTGYYYAMAAARKGATVVMLNRESERAHAATKSLREAVPDGKFDDSIACDLMSFGSVKAATGKLATAYDIGIDVLCCNAGIMAFPDDATEDGFDVQMQTNHLSHFLLCALLFPLLEAAAARTGDARIVNHSSIARQGIKLEDKYFGMNGGDLGGNGASMFFGGARWVRYAQTKLANAVFTHVLQRKLTAKDSKVKAVCAAPGLANTQLQPHTLAMGGMQTGCCGNYWIMSMAQSAADGAQGILTASFLETAGASLWEPKGMAIAGAVAPAKPAKAETDVAAGDMLWAASEKAVGLSFL